MKELNDKLEKICAIREHYLVKARDIGHNYFNEFLDTAVIIKSLLKKREFEYWCTEKMLLKQQPFAEKKFIQFAVETSVVRFFGEKFPLNFKVEAKINPTNNNDVDCQFNDNGFTFNVEVKCPDFVSKEKIDNIGGFKYGTIGRLPDRGQEAFKDISSALDEGLTIKGEPSKPHLVTKNMDYNLETFLKSAHEKFNPKQNEKEVNVLIVGCDHERDMQNWFNYLWANEGLFTNQSFADNVSYKNVDLVVLTNQYFKHNKYFDKKVSDCWSIEKCFNLISSNPNRHLPKEKAMKHFIKILPNFSEELFQYVVPVNAPGYVKDSMRIVWFVKDQLEKQQGKYLFAGKPAIKT